MNSSGTIFLSPNPAMNELIVRSQEFGDGEIEIYDMLGEKLFTMDRTQQKERLRINVSSLAPGIYFVRVKTDKGMWEAKFVKE